MVAAFGVLAVMVGFRLFVTVAVYGLTAAFPQALMITFYLGMFAALSLGVTIWGPVVIAGLAGVAAGRARQASATEEP